MQIPDSTPGHGNQAAYAAHRRCSEMSVSRAVKGGRLSKSLTRDPTTGKVVSIDFAAADQEWLANTDLSRAPPYVKIRESERNATLTPPPPAVEPAAEPVDVATASARLKSAQADLAVLKYNEAAGELVLARDVENKLIDAFTACKTRLLALPSRARQALPHLTLADLAALTAIIREALEELERGDA